MFTVEAHKIMKSTSRKLGMELRNRDDDLWKDPTFHLSGYTFGASMDVTFNQIEDLQELVNVARAALDEWMTEGIKKD
jgi:hypothetical protein